MAAKDTTMLNRFIQGVLGYLRTYIFIYALKNAQLQACIMLNIFLKRAFYCILC